MSNEHPWPKEWDELYDITVTDSMGNQYSDGNCYTLKVRNCKFDKNCYGNYKDSTWTKTFPELCLLVEQLQDKCKNCEKKTLIMKNTIQTLRCDHCDRKIEIGSRAFVSNKNNRLTTRCDKCDEVSRADKFYSRFSVGDKVKLVYNKRVAEEYVDDVEYTIKKIIFNDGIKADQVDTSRFCALFENDTLQQTTHHTYKLGVNLAFLDKRELVKCDHCGTKVTAVELRIYQNDRNCRIKRCQRCDTAALDDMFYSKFSIGDEVKYNEQYYYYQRNDNKQLTIKSIEFVPDALKGFSKFKAIFEENVFPNTGTNLAYLDKVIGDSPLQKVADEHEKNKQSTTRDKLLKMINVELLDPKRRDMNGDIYDTDIITDMCRISNEEMQNAIDKATDKLFTDSLKKISIEAKVKKTEDPYIQQKTKEESRDFKQWEYNQHECELCGEKGSHMHRIEKYSLATRDNGFLIDVYRHDTCDGLIEQYCMIKNISFLDALNELKDKLFTNKKEVKKSSDKNVHFLGTGDLR